MFEILTSVVIKAIEKILDMGADIGKCEVQKRRKLLSKLLFLYESLEELEQASEKAFKEFLSYASGDSTPTKVVIRNRLEDLEHSYKRCANTINEVDTILSIYDNDLYVSLRGAILLKGAMLSKISGLSDVQLLLEIYPKMIKNGNYSPPSKSNSPAMAI